METYLKYTYRPIFPMETYLKYTYRPIFPVETYFKGLKAIYEDLKGEFKNNSVLLGFLLTKKRGN